jgi:SAM-dependent methyltransferase
MRGERELFETITRSAFDSSGLGWELAERRLAFALSRYDEGERTVALLGQEYPDLMARQNLVVLDLGSGNGGMLFPFAHRARLVALDIYIDQELVAFRRAAKIPLVHLLGEASRIPIASGSIDVVLMAETLEHLTEPKRAGEELARIVSPGGVCLLSTPPRLKFALKPDPHYGIRGLALLPDTFQRLVAERVFGHADYNVHHLYATSWGVERQFPQGAFRSRVICPHRTDWTRHLAWAYLAFERR